MTLDKVKWGFIGCGEVTEKKSGPAFNMVKDSEVVAVMSRDEEKVKSYAMRHNIPRWYTDAQELIGDEDVNAIYIATPPSSHATFAIMAMKAGKPVYIEKPMAASYEDCARINRISRETGVPCFVAYYRRYLPYFQKVRQLVEEGEIGNVINIQIRFAQPPRDLDYNSTNLPWRVQPDIAGGGYFYDLAPHQLDLLQDMFGCILEAEGYKSNRGGLYEAEDTISACFKFESGLPGSGSWCFVAHESAKEDRIEIIGDKGMICFSVFTYEPIALHTERGREEILPPNPPHVQLPQIKTVVEHLQGKAVCTCDGVSATPTNWVMDKILCFKSVNKIFAGMKLSRHQEQDLPPCPDGVHLTPHNPYIQHGNEQKQYTACQQGGQQRFSARHIRKYAPDKIKILRAHQHNCQHP